ncbi:hypothetical protein B0H63DRAFT_564071 [Podospora didyma]|uniref:Clr5 domain-containing protein n=1 Tax=Podospora didyma TaxID=330526 RepID=A0AAE0KAS6_9PEZI|nr:hypothetical protein B0H63DRAFT_564071 [Podospora didyma]
MSDDMSAPRNAPDFSPHHHNPQKEMMKVVIPTKPSDWEAVKHAIEDLYMNNNVRLKDVIEIMHTVYGFRATARMYKAQFARWNWHKYSRTYTKPPTPESTTAPLPSVPASQPKGRKKGTARPRFDVVGSALQLAEKQRLHHKPSNLQSNLLEADESRRLTTTMSAYRNFILGFSESDPRWRSATSFTKMGTYNTTMISHLVASLYLFKNQQIQQGGRLLRAAFLELDDLISDGHVAAIWDCCVSVPQLTLNHGRRDILLTFLRYLAALTAAKYPSHPLARITRYTLNLVSHLPRFEHIQSYTTAVWQMWSDTIIALLGHENISTLHTHRAYLLIQPVPDAVLARRLIADYEHLVAKARHSLGADSTTALGVEFDALLTQLRFRLPDPNFDARLHRVLAKLGSKPSNFGIPPTQWEALEDRFIYRGSWCLLAMHAQAVMGDDDKAAGYRRAFLEAPTDADWGRDWIFTEVAAATYTVLDGFASPIRSECRIDELSIPYAELSIWASRSSTSNTTAGAGTRSCPDLLVLEIEATEDPTTYKIDPETFDLIFKAFNTDPSAKYSITENI